MFKDEAKEAAPILQRALVYLLAAAPTRGRPGSDLRTACGALGANAEIWLQADIAGPPLVNCFDVARAAGITQAQLGYVRGKVEPERAFSVGAILTKQAIIHTCLATEGLVIARMRFKSRDEVEKLRAQMNEAFALAEEIAADELEQMTYRALVALHGAITFHLIETARPLPRMLRFVFAAPMPTLMTAQRLYYDASRADELRDENKVVHPAFMQPSGRGLSE